MNTLSPFAACFSQANAPFPPYMQSWASAQHRALLAQNMPVSVSPSLMANQQVRLPILQPLAWDLPTALNLAYFSALAYGDVPLLGSQSNDIFQELNNARAPLCDFESHKGRFVLRSCEESPFCPPVTLSQLGVRLTLVSTARQALIFIQGTDNLLTILLDSAKSTVGAETIHRLRHLLDENRPALDRYAQRLAKRLKLELAPLDFVEHKTSLLEYISHPSNTGAHMGFLLITAAFLHEPTFLQAFFQQKAYDKELFLAGHSLGGALALFLARELQCLCHKRITVYTFGCPRTGSKAFTQTISRKIIHHRVVNNQDPVAWIASGEEWQDHGILHFLSREPVPAILAYPRRTHDWPPDHFIREYTKQLQEILLYQAQCTESSYPWNGEIALH